LSGAFFIWERGEFYSPKWTNGKCQGAIAPALVLFLASPTLGSPSPTGVGEGNPSLSANKKTEVHPKGVHFSFPGVLSSVARTKADGNEKRYTQCRSKKGRIERSFARFFPFYWIMSYFP